MEATPIQKIGPNTYYLAAGKAIVTMSADRIADADNFGRLLTTSAPNLSQAIDIMSWGKNNDLPQAYEELILDNNVVAALMLRKRDIYISDRLWAYTKRIQTGKDGKVETIHDEVEMPAAASEFFASMDPDLDTYLLTAAGELVKHSLVLNEYTRNKGGQIMSMRAHECKYIRAGMKDDNGNINTWYWSAFWRRKKINTKEKIKIFPMPVYTGEDNKQPKFVKPVGDYFFNDGYYPIPVWRGGKDWIELSNMIPEFHINNMLNGYSIRFHIMIPAGYFLDYEKYNACTNEAEKQTVLNASKKAEQDFMDDVNRWLAGIAAAGRTLFTKYEFEQATGKEYPGIKINPVSYDMKDEALIKLFEASNTANVSNQGIHPSLANIDITGKLFGSGTEVRNAYLLFLITSAPQVRRMLLKGLDLVKKVNGWPPDVYFGIKDFELAPLSESPNGVKPATNHVGGA
jgi:hypothetical protein